MDVVSAMPSGLGGMSPADVKALMSNGSGGFGGGDSASLILLLLLFGSGNGFGGNNAASNEQSVLRAIDGSDADIRYLGNILNTDVTAIQSSLCDIKTGMATQTGAIISSSKDVINAIQAGNCTLSKELAQCCCENRLAICEQTNTLDKSITQNRFDNQMGFSKVSNDLCTGFANLGFQNQQNTAAITDTIKGEGSATRALIRDREFAQLEKENATLRLSASQTSQTLELEKVIKDTCSR